ncbi:MAG: phosphotransferase family protein [Candidatus Binatia bacterium]
MSEDADLARKLERYLGAQVEGAKDLRVEVKGRISRGYSRENWLFDAEWREGGEAVRRKLILRRDPPGGVSVVDTAREPEFRVLRALERTEIPVPRAHWLETTGEWLERPFLVLERYEGTVDPRILTDASPLGIDRDARVRLAGRFCELLAKIHRLDWRALGLGEIFAVPNGNPAELELRRAVEFVERSLLEPQPELFEVIGWLERHVPPAGRVALVHGDFRAENAIVDGERIVVLLDWELARLSDPMADLAWHMMPITMPFHFIPGAWEPADLLRRYGELTGEPVDPARLRFWQVLIMLNVVAIGMMTAKSFLERRTIFSSLTAGTIRQVVAVLYGMIGDAR